MFNILFKSLSATSLSLFTVILKLPSLVSYVMALLSKVVANLNQVLSAKKDTKEQNFLNKLPLKALTSTIIYLALVLLLLLLAPKFL